MKVFENMDREQADMFRWIRRNMNESMFQELTGKKMGESASALDVDRALREAFIQQRAEEFAKINVQASRIKSGILPVPLGKALFEYSDAYAYASDFQEGLGGQTHKDVATDLQTKFLALCEEISKLRF